MAYDAAFLHERARHCRELAKGARDAASIKHLNQMSDDFEEEARRLSETSVAFTVWQALIIDGPNATSWAAPTTDPVMATQNQPGSRA